MAKQISSLCYEQTYKKLLLPLGMFALRITEDTALADDVVQGVFADVWERVRQGFSPDNLKTYLYTAVRNRAYDAIRERGVKTDEMPEDVNDEEVDQSERDASLWRAIGRLPERQRQALLLCKRDGMTYAEAAEEMGISARTVENLLATALRKLRGSNDLQFFLTFFV